MVRSLPVCKDMVDLAVLVLSLLANTCTIDYLLHMAAQGLELWIPVFGSALQQFWLCGMLGSLGGRRDVLVLLT